MIRALELILDQVERVVGGIPAEDVRAEWADAGFLLLNLQLDPDRLAEESDVVFFGHPRREVGVLTLPVGSEVDLLEAPKRFNFHLLQ